MTNYKVINGNNIELLKEFPDNYFDAIVTDPPYGLGKEPDASQMLKEWIENGYMEIKGSGFMGKEWDAFVPQPIFWKEVFRVLKHGGHVLSFFGTRTYDWGVMAIRLAGFEVRDCIQWLYGSGFPKSYNIAKGIEGKLVNGSSSWNNWQNLDGEKEDRQLGYFKMNDEQGNRPSNYEQGQRTSKVKYTTEEAKQWDGWGSALKPANEPIVLARKPLEKGLSIAENVLKWGVGGINIDGCRVNIGEKIDSHITKGQPFLRNSDEYEQIDRTSHSKGRFPTNLILTHHPECECLGSIKVKAISGGKGEKSMGGMGKNGIYGKYALDKLGANAGGLGDENGEEEIEDWRCHEDCPIKILDEQSGESKSAIRKPNGKAILNVEKGWNDNSMIDKTERGHNDKGGASRFFYVAKASKSERNKGLDDFEEKPLAFSNQAKAELKRGNEDFDGGKGHGNSIRHLKNFHPTVKPIKLMQYLVRLITPPNGIVLDPFCGSGTTGVACKLEGFNFVGMEQDPEYTKIAQARIENYIDEKKEVINTTKDEETENEQNENNQLSLF